MEWGGLGWGGLERVWMEYGVVGSGGVEWIGVGRGGEGWGGEIGAGKPLRRANLDCIFVARSAPDICVRH